MTNLFPLSNLQVRGRGGSVLLQQARCFGLEDSGLASGHTACANRPLGQNIKTMCFSFNCDSRFTGRQRWSFERVDRSPPQTVHASGAIADKAPEMSR